MESSWQFLQRVSQPAHGLDAIESNVWFKDTLEKLPL